MQPTTKFILTLVFILVILPFALADGCYYNPNGGVEGCRSVTTWGSYDASIKAETLSSARNNPGDRYMAWCPFQNSVPYVRSDSKLSTCGCPSEATFENSLQPGQCDTRRCSNCGNYVSYCKPGSLPECGDGTVNQASEQCDDGNSNNNDGCTNSCKTPRCGDGFVWSGNEQCEFDSQCNDGNSGTVDICSSCSCQVLSRCGDGVVNQASEQCDDGNSNNNDGCTNSCKTPRCGDGFVWSGNEQCEFDSQCNDGNSGTFDTCSSCNCQNLPTCQNECSAGEKKCVGNQIYECGNFDADSCREFGFKNDCFFHTEGQPYFKCEGESSVQYKETKDGFCNDKPGNNDFCDSNTKTVKLSTDNCQGTSCTEDDFCLDNDVFTKKKCNSGSCNSASGKCTMTPSEETFKKQECGIGSAHAQCIGDDIFRIDNLKGCREQNGSASCYTLSPKTPIESCGTDTCISHTSLDPFVFEYVDDNSGCMGNNNPFCGLDQSFYDMCVAGTDILLQPHCNGKDHAFLQFDCNSKDGCYDFTYKGCVKCNDGDGNCIQKNCTLTGKEYRDYNCGSGVCNYTVSVMQDIDKDNFDDRCDSCIDVDRDGICDDKDICPNLPNKNQIDYDHDGSGDECDNDRDGDGYAADFDCNDWNAKIHPFAIEIEGNSIDDDCNDRTKDAIADTPMQVFYVDISMNDVAKSGENYVFVVSVTNMAQDTMQDVVVSAAIPGFQLKDVKMAGQMKKGATVSRIFTFSMPKNKEGYEYLRVTVNNNLYKRVIYKEVKIITNK